MDAALQGAACRLVAVVGGNVYPCRSHEDDQHHFAAYWPACPAPFCRLPPDHRSLHDIPSGCAEIKDIREAAETAAPETAGGE